MNDDEIHCLGFASCIYASTIQASSLFSAYGSYSAFGFINITCNEHSICYGASSCRNINRFQRDESISCGGYRSCFGSTFERTSVSDGGYYNNMHFSGDESGAFTKLNLNQNTDIYAVVRLSLCESNISMYKSSNPYAYGFLGLTGAKLYCENAQICKIYCFNYGCYNVSSING